MPPDLELVVAATPEEAAARVADLLACAARAGRSLVVAGGSTPRRAYELAAELESDWSRASIWWGDERCVPPDDERSNFRLVEEALLRRLPAPPAAVHRIRGELEPERAAAEYDEALRESSLDLVLLGLGPDGHTASLFPNAPSLDERLALAVAAEPGREPLVERVTLTIPALAAAPTVIFLAVGRDKADAARRAFRAEPRSDTPASLVRSDRGRTTVVLDQAAAALL